MMPLYIHSQQSVAPTQGCYRPASVAGTIGRRREGAVDPQPHPESSECTQEPTSRRPSRDKQCSRHTTKFILGTAAVACTWRTFQRCQNRTQLVRDLRG